MIERINILATTKILVLNHHYMISTRTKDSATKLVPDTNLVHVNSHVNSHVKYHVSTT